MSLRALIDTYMTFSSQVLFLQEHLIKLIDEIGWIGINLYLLILTRDTEKVEEVTNTIKQIIENPHLVDWENSPEIIQALTDIYEKHYSDLEQQEEEAGIRS